MARSVYIDGSYRTVFVTTTSVGQVRGGPMDVGARFIALVDVSVEGKSDLFYLLVELAFKHLNVGALLLGLKDLVS